MNNIILIGMPLSGKSTLGKKLSEVLNYDFLDTDSLIEEMENKSISDIFKVYGEAYFRKKESEIIDNIKKKENKVISTGGGLPIYNNNIYKLNQIGFTVYLRVSLEELINRAEDDKCYARPLLKEDKLKSLEKIYRERIKIYEKAHTIICNKNSGESLKAIMDAYNNWEKVR